MKTVFTFFLGIAFYLTSSTTFAQGITLELVENSASIPNYTTPIPVTSAQYSFTSSFSTSSNGPTAPSRPDLPPLTITKQFDPSTAALQKAMLLGQSFQYVRLSFFRADGTLAYRIVLGDVYLTNYSASGAASCPSGCPGLSESVSLLYRQYVSYNPAAPASSTGLSTVTWDRVTNTANVDAALIAAATAQ
ncbi:type VI secretion system tube protein Hcp [Spirosoma validum]|uniref:Type VI secretion system tube protein Hcp n=1 Tax=Spirosoma validum TaxID=2771355 RepID=A0A927GDQ3_9BACT|nr:type VI secretion system tube protein Hcp [Spirosoma validum]MBD2753908.1 type VI secretion system tube protein Hcp [Spirosoma validum]